MIRYKLTNNFNNSDFKKITISDGTLAGSEVVANSLLVSFSEHTRDSGYSELIREMFLNEKGENVNEVIDNETIKFYSAKLSEIEPTNPLTIKFNFYNKDNGTYEDSYLAAGFEQEELDDIRSNIRNSFYRIDFFDSGNQKQQNFLFSEFLNVGKNTQDTDFPFRRIFWKKNDSKFIKEETFVELYFDVTFFNAKTGLTTRFLNNNVIQNPTTLTAYNANPSWRFAKIKLLNPYFNLTNIGSTNHIFYVDPINSNNDSVITFNEVIIQ